MLDKERRKITRDYFHNKLFKKKRKNYFKSFGAFFEDFLLKKPLLNEA
jgi:hypothetical protein